MLVSNLTASLALSIAAKLLNPDVFLYRNNTSLICSGLKLPITSYCFAIKSGAAWLFKILRSKPNTFQSSLASSNGLNNIARTALPPSSLVRLFQTDGNTFANASIFLSVKLSPNFSDVR